METWLLILGMALITFAIRYSLFAFPDLRFPPLVRQGLHYVPTAVLSAIVLPGMLIPDGQHWAFSLDNAYLLNAQCWPSGISMGIQPGQCLPAGGAGDHCHRCADPAFASHHRRRSAGVLYRALVIGSAASVDRVI